MGMRQAKELIFQKIDEPFVVEHFDMEEVEKVCVGKAANLVVDAYREENDISEQEQIAVIYMKNKPNRCYQLRNWDMSFLYDNVPTGAFLD